MGNTKVVVKAVEQKPEEEQLTMTAAVKGVKTIEVSFNKAIASPDAVKVTVKKGTAARDCKATVDGSKITLAMDAKLTKGTYTVSVEGVDTTAMTADVVVEKDETLTSFWIGDYIVAKSLTETTTASIKYAALNQYEEKMSTSDVTVTCSFGKIDDQKPSTYATATAEGTITVKDIPDILAIIGTKGTVVIVGDMGVTSTKEVSYNSFSKATTAEVLGTYHKNSATVKSITEGDDPSDYELLFSMKDQYGYEVSADDANTAASITTSLNGGLTNVTVNLADEKSYQTRTVDGKDYIAVPLKAIDARKKAFAGDATLTIVNNLHGLLVNQPLTVAKNVVIKSVNITADNGLYEGQENELHYEITDADGKNVTSYAVLSNSDIIQFSTNTLGLRWERNADGTAKLVSEIPDGYVDKSNPKSDKNTKITSITTQANYVAGGNLLVNTFTFTVNEKRVAKSVSGIAADTTLATAKGGDTLTIKSKKFILADQYSGSVKDGESAFVNTIFDGAAAAAGTSVVCDNKGGAFDAINIDVANKKIVATPSAVTAGTATVYLKFRSAADVKDGKNAAPASSSNYDAKFYLSVYDTDGVDVSTLSIKSINDNFAVTEANAKNSAWVLGKTVVIAKVGGVETVIPSSQYAVVKNENNEFNGEDVSKGVNTKTAKLTIQVTTWDAANTAISTQISKEYVVSKEAAKLYKVTGTNASAATNGAITLVNGAATLDSSDFINMFTYKNQFNEDVTDPTAITKDTVTYSVKLIQKEETGAYKLYNDGLNSAKITFTKAGTYKIKVFATTPDGSTKDFTYVANVGK